MCIVFHIDIPIILYDSEKANREEDRPVAPKFWGMKKKGLRRIFASDGSILHFDYTSSCTTECVC